MTCYSIEQRTRKCVKGYGFLSFVRNLSNKYRKILGTGTKTGLDAVKTAFKKLVHKLNAATREFIGNKIAEKIVKISDMNSSFA